MKEGNRRQRTLANEIEMTGVGVHTGRTTRLRMLPAGAGFGLRFRRVDLPDAPEFPANLDHVLTGQLDRRTTVGLDRDRSVATVEHLLAVCTALGLDNALFEVDGPEMPFFDGSALPLAQAIVECGLAGQDRECDAFRLAKPVVFDRYPVQMIAIPATSLRISYFIEFDNAVLPGQAGHFKVTPKKFMKRLAPARTFCFLRDVERLREMGLIRGGSMECAVVIDEDRILNDDLRYPDEMIRHKAVDLLGDLALLGRRIEAHITAWRAGHAWHIEFLKHLQEEALQ